MTKSYLECDLSKPNLQDNYTGKISTITRQKKTQVFYIFLCLFNNSFKSQYMNVKKTVKQVQYVKIFYVI